MTVRAVSLIPDWLCFTIEESFDLSGFLQRSLELAFRLHHCAPDEVIRQLPL